MIKSFNKKNLIKNTIATSALIALSALANISNASNWPQDDKSLVGYVEGWHNDNRGVIQNALNSGYNVIVFSFANINGEQVSKGSLSEPDNFLISETQNIHANSKNKKGLAIVSFGGQNNTFNPTTSTDFNKLGQNIAAFLEKYNFDGIDLDIETIPAGITNDNIISMMNSLRAQYKQDTNKDVVITSAPQIAGGYNNPNLPVLAPSNIFSKDFLEKAKFDAIFIQEYNQFGGAKFGGKFDTDQGFITASFGALTNYIPASTKVVPGEPATPRAGSGLSDPTSIVNDLMSGNILSNNRFGGIMTWDINYDTNNNWNFGRTVSSVL
jgi:chitinase